MWTTRDGSYSLLRLAVVAPVASFLIYDLIVDAFVKEEIATTHFVVEAIMFVAVLIILVIDLKDLATLRARLRREETRNKALAGQIAAGIEIQMDEWQFTPSEKDVAWMIIKGYRFSEIADLRQVKESTTRLQATTLYRKAGVRGRAEFVAEIVHELLAPVWDNTQSAD